MTTEEVSRSYSAAAHLLEAAAHLELLGQRKEADRLRDQAISLAAMGRDLRP